MQVWSVEQRIHLSEWNKSVCVSVFVFFSVQITTKQRVLNVPLAGSFILTHIPNTCFRSAVLQHRKNVLMRVLLTPAVSLLRGGV